MNLQRPRNGEFHSALYHEFNDENEYEEPIYFNFKAPDDEQYKQRTQQYSSGELLDNASFNIYTTENLPFKAEDRVELLTNGRMFKIKEVREMFNSSTSIVNSLFGNVSYNKGKWLNLGEY